MHVGTCRSRSSVSSVSTVVAHLLVKVEEQTPVVWIEAVLHGGVVHNTPQVWSNTANNHDVTILSILDMFEVLATT